MSWKLRFRTSMSFSPPYLTVMLPSGERSASQHSHTASPLLVRVLHHWQINSQKDISPIPCKGILSPRWQMGTWCLLCEDCGTGSVSPPLLLQASGSPPFVMVFHIDFSTIWYTFFFSPDLLMYFHSSAPLPVSNLYFMFLKDS